MKDLYRSRLLAGPPNGIVGKSRRWNPAFYNLKQWVMSILKKWIGAASGKAKEFVAKWRRRVR